MIMLIAWEFGIVNINMGRCVHNFLFVVVTWSHTSNLLILNMLKIQWGVDMRTN